MAHGPWKKPIDFGGNPDHVTLGLGHVAARTTHRRLYFYQLLVSQFRESTGKPLMSAQCPEN